MNIHHIRNATAILDYGGKKFLIDPMLAEKRNTSTIYFERSFSITKKRSNESSS